MLLTLFSSSDISGRTAGLKLKLGVYLQYSDSLMRIGTVHVGIVQRVHQRALH